MKISNIILVTVILLTLAGIGAALWLADPQTGNGRAESDLVVAATIFPLADIVKNIAGEYAEVVTIVPPDASPHSYELTPQKVVELTGVDIIFSINYGLDDQVVAAAQRLLGDGGNVKTEVADEGIALREFGQEDEHIEEGGHEHEGIDPHYWLTAENAQKITQTVASRLSEIDPANSENYQRNAAEYIAELEQLEQELQTTARGLKQKHFIAMHDAWSYFADQYGLELVATYEPEEGQEPSPVDIQSLGRVINEYDITVFYAEPQKASTAATRLLSEEFGLDILTLDAEGSYAGTAGYIDMMRRNMQAIAEGSK